MIEKTTHREMIMSNPEPAEAGRTSRGHPSSCFATSVDVGFCPPAPDLELIPPTSFYSRGESIRPDDERLEISSTPMVGTERIKARGEPLDACHSRWDSELLSDVDLDKVIARICLSGSLATVPATVYGIAVT